MSSGTTERGYHFLRILEEGKQFTSEVLKENEALRMENVRLREEVREREGRLSALSGGGSSQLLSQLEREKREAVRQLEELRRELSQVQAENREFAERYVHIEKQNGNLASLYVATYNLHSTLKFPEVLTNVREIVINLIGSEMFGVYLVNGAGTELELIAEEGLGGGGYEVLRRNDVVEQALASGGAVVQERPPVGEVVEGEVAEAIACAPLSIHGQLIGVIAIYRLLAHKEGFEEIDRELLDMLAGHAATALYSARLYGQTERKLTTLQSFLDLLRIPKNA